MNSYEFLSSLWNTIPEDARNITSLGYAAVMVASILLACIVSFLYTRYFDANTTGSRINRSFVLLAPAITTIFVTVQYSLPLSLGLLGALSIVRFRTPIKEPEEIGFILLVVACSISVATFNVAFAAMLIAIVGVCLELRVRFVKEHVAGNYLTLSVLLASPAERNAESVSQMVDYLDSLKVASRVVNMQMTSNETSCTIVLRKVKMSPQALMEMLKQRYPSAKLNIYQR